MVKITQKGDKVLKQRAKEVALSDIGGKKIAGIVKKMTTALWASFTGVAIAAPQIGESVRIFLVEASVFDKEGFTDEEKKKKRQPIVFINPKIIRTSKTASLMQEGCLSVDGIFGAVARFNKVTLQALDENGNKKTINASGFLAQIFQHETDHLDGVLFVEKAVKLAKPEEKK